MLSLRVRTFVRKLPVKMHDLCAFAFFVRRTTHRRSQIDRIRKEHPLFPFETRRLGRTDLLTAP